MKVLILRFSSIGDIVLITPVLSAIHAQRPEIEIHVATKPQFKALLENNPAISQLHFLEASDKELIQELKKEQFDCIVDLHHKCIRNSGIFFSKIEL